MNPSSGYRRAPGSSQFIRFRGTRDLKLSRTEQDAIRNAEEALGYRHQQRTPAQQPAVGIEWFIRAWLALLFLSTLFVAIAQWNNADFSPRTESQAASRPLANGARRDESRSAPRRNLQTAPPQLAAPSSAPAPALAASPTATDSNVGITEPPAQFGSAADVYAAAPIVAVPERQSPAPPLIQTLSGTQLAKSACPGALSPAQPIASSGLLDNFGPVQPAPPSPTWHRFTSPHSVPPDRRGWHTFGPPQSDARSPEASQNIQSLESLRRFKHHPVRGHSLLRRVLGGVGQVLEGVAEGVAAPLQGLTEGFQFPPQAFPYFAPQGAEGRAYDDLWQARR